MSHQIYTAILLADEDFELANFQVLDANPIMFPVMIPSSEFEGHRHPSRPETMARREVVFFVDEMETELAQMIHGDHVLIYRTRPPEQHELDEGAF